MTHFVVAFSEPVIPRLIESINQYVGIYHDCYQMVVAYKGVRPNGR